MVKSLEEADDVWREGVLLLLGPAAVLKLGQTDVLQQFQVN